MNGNYYQNPTFPSNDIIEQDLLEPRNNTVFQTSSNNILSDNLLLKQSYIENVLKLNIGKKVEICFYYPDSKERSDKKYQGVIEKAGKDYLVLSNTTTGKWYLFKTIFLDYVEFSETIN